jgi:hypothetical protein
MRKLAAIHCAVDFRAPFDEIEKLRALCAREISLMEAFRTSGGVRGE